MVVIRNKEQPVDCDFVFVLLSMRYNY